MSRNFRTATLAVLCVLVTASANAKEITAADVRGRWAGIPQSRVAPPKDCVGDACSLTLDIAPCDDALCGVEVASGNTCGATALRMRVAEGSAEITWYEGTLSLAKGSEPYAVVGHVFEDAKAGGLLLHFNGDTGGEFRGWRRSFPFQITLKRVSDPICHADKPVS